MSKRPLNRPGARMLNHLELFYAPGERALARMLLECLGFRVLDPQTDPIPENLGPAAAPFLIVYLDPDDDDVIDNVLYASEVPPVQWRFESALKERFAKDEPLAALHQDFRDSFAKIPQAMTHFGVGYPSGREIQTALKKLAAAPEFEDRVTLSQVYEPGGPGSLDDRVIQAFVYTDVVSIGLLCAGQQIELQVRLDGV